MTLQSSGAISLGNVNTELGRSATATISLGETAVRNLAGVSSGAISLSSLYGKSNAPPVTHALSPSTQNKLGASPSSFFAVSSSVTGGTVTSRSWGLISTTGGTWTFSAPTSANTNIDVVDVPGSDTATAEVYCDAVVGGVTYRATGTYNYTNTSFE